jgi:hypothetical protein
VRLWSLHPEYLDARGLVALWREALLARKVLRGQTIGYRHHTQLVRFSAQPDPIAAIECYLQGILEEATRRVYRFDAGKVKAGLRCLTMQATEGQLDFELKHLLKKLETRNPSAYKSVRVVKTARPHPIFTIVPGGRAPWEKAR